MLSTIICRDSIEQYAQKFREPAATPRLPAPYDGLFLVNGVPFTDELDRCIVDCYECKGSPFRGHPTEVAYHVTSVHRLSILEYAQKFEGRWPECPLPEFRLANH